MMQRGWKVTAFAEKISASDWRAGGSFELPVAALANEEERLMISSQHSRVYGKSPP
jgi:hypothetical protein